MKSDLSCLIFPCVGQTPRTRIYVARLCILSQREKVNIAQLLLRCLLAADSASMSPNKLPVLEEEGFAPDLSNSIKNERLITKVHGGNWTLSWRQGLACRDPYR